MIHSHMMIHLQLLGYPIVISWNHWWCKYEFPCTIIYVGRNLAISHDCWTEHTLSLSFFWVPGDFFFADWATTWQRNIPQVAKSTFKHRTARMSLMYDGLKMWFFHTNQQIRFFSARQWCECWFWNPLTQRLSSSYPPCLPNVHQVPSVNFAIVQICSNSYRMVPPSDVNVGL